MSLYSIIGIGTLMCLPVLLLTSWVINQAFKNCKTLNSFHGVKIVPDEDEETGYLNYDTKETKLEKAKETTVENGHVEYIKQSGM